MSDNTDQTGGVNIGGSVGPVGGDIVGHDIINNITFHSLDQVEGLATLLKASITQLSSIPDPDALDSLAVVLDEIAKLYLLIDTEVTRYLSLSFDDPQQMFPNRSVLLSLDGGQVRARAAEARGHCEKISRIYSNRLRRWFQDRLSSDAMGPVERAFGGLALSDARMWHTIDELAEWLSQKASQTLNLVDAGDVTGARQTVKDARRDCQRMRQQLADTISMMRHIQGELIRIAP